MQFVPDTFTLDKAQFALERIRAGQVPAQFCAQGVSYAPADAASIEAWAAENEEFAKALEAAKIMGADALAEECIRIADTTVTTNLRFRIETRMRQAALWNPAKYGPRAEDDGKKNVHAHFFVPFDQVSPTDKAAVEAFFGLASHVG